MGNKKERIFQQRTGAKVHLAELSARSRQVRKAINQEMSNKRKIPFEKIQVRNS